jgi:soluble lytic murein transglycosylase-like protein
MFNPFFRVLILVGGFPLLVFSAQQAVMPQPSQAMRESLRKQRASLASQWQAVRRQMAEKSSAVAITPAHFIDPLPAWTPPLNPLALPVRAAVWNPADCPALEAEKVSELVAAAAEKQSLDPALLRAVIKQESGFKPCAVSPKGAQGLMQLMPSTAQDLHVADAFDPRQNVQAGAAYLRQLLSRYKGDLRLALVGYNAGPRRADQPPGTPYPLETQDYVASIFAALGIDDSSPDASDQEPKP